MQRPRPVVWTELATVEFLQLRVSHDSSFNGKRGSASDGWKKVAIDMARNHGMEYTPKVCKKKWDNMLKKYKEIKTAKTGVKTEDGETETPTTWAFFSQLDEFLGERHNIAFPYLESGRARSRSPTSCFTGLDDQYCHTPPHLNRPQPDPLQPDPARSNRAFISILQTTMTPMTPRSTSSYHAIVPTDEAETSVRPGREPGFGTSPQVDIPSTSLSSASPLAPQSPFPAPEAVYTDPSFHPPARKRNREDFLLHRTSELLESVAGRINGTPSQDETFGQMVAQRLSNISNNKVKLEVMKTIASLLFDAELADMSFVE